MYACTHGHVRTCEHANMFLNAGGQVRLNCTSFGDNNCDSGVQCIESDVNGVLTPECGKRDDVTDATPYIVASMLVHFRGETSAKIEDSSTLRKNERVFERVRVFY